MPIKRMDEVGSGCVPDEHGKDSLLIGLTASGSQ